MGNKYREYFTAALYDGEIIEETNELLDYSVPYIDPPDYEPNPDID